MGASNTSSVRNLEVNRLGAVKVMMIVVVESIKCSRHEKVDGSKLKWAVDKSRRDWPRTRGKPIQKGRWRQVPAPDCQ